MMHQIGMWVIQCYDHQYIMTHEESLMCLTQGPIVQGRTPDTIWRCCVEAALTLIQTG